MNQLKLFWKNNRSIIFYILVLFIATRIAITCIGLGTQAYLTTSSYQNWKSEIKEGHPVLNIWAVWDSEWYLKIANNGYEIEKPFNPQEYQPIGFFPLYPLIVGVLGFIIGNPFIAGIIVSNIALLLACFVLYKLVQIDYGTETAKRSVWYLFIFPTAYIFSAIYPESLLLLLVLSTLLFAKKERWWLAGLLGFFAALAKPVGFFVFIPVLLMYLQNIGYRWQKIRAEIASVLLIPFGAFCFGIYSYFITGDFFAYSHTQAGAWSHYLANPLFVIIDAFTKNNADTAINAIGIIVSLIIMIFGFRKIHLSYSIYALILILFTPTSGIIVGSLRYLAVIFPIIIVLAIWGKNENSDKAITVSMAMLQGFLIVFWVTGLWFTT